MLSSSFFNSLPTTTTMPTMPVLRKMLSLGIFILYLSTTTMADDVTVMNELQKAISPPGWSGKTQCCQWDGVKCDSSGRVTSINLASKSLSGTLPSDLSSLSALTSLSLQKNSLSGPLPSLANLSELQNVNLDFNSFSSIPAGCFKGLTSLQTLSLGNNLNLEQWNMPTELKELTSLVSLDMGSVNLVGSIPDVFNSFPSLQEVRLSYNNLTGSLPKSFKGSGIQRLWINNQVSGLSGNIDVLGSMTQLSQVWIQKNLFTGPIPDLSECKNLVDLQVRDNHLTGVVPSSLIKLSTLQNVSLGNNMLQGPFPYFDSGVKVALNGVNRFCKTSPGACDPQVAILLDIASAFGYPYKLADSWNGNDPCAQWSSVVCDPQNNIITLNFAKQGLTGTISPAIANLTALRIIYLNDNHLTGPLPDSLTTLSKLQILDVSNNDLTGDIPKFNGVKLVTSGNELLGKKNSGKGGETDPSSDSSGSSGSSGSGSAGSSASTSLSPLWIACIVAIVVLVILVVLIGIYKFVLQKRLKLGRVTDPEDGKENKTEKTMDLHRFNGVPSEFPSQSSSDPSDVNSFDGGAGAISMELLRQVTNNFSEHNILGRGGFGVVYGGELQDGTKIAVKRMESVEVGTKGLKEFQAEHAVLTKVRHRHLVALLGHCINGNERLLVYECMPQGSLSQHLFDWKEYSYQPLTWKQRVSIALDVARGVEYLHGLAQQSFIHRDLKPSNILLGDDMRAKVADFGLVKNAPEGKYSIETKLAGTFGYLAPEYAATGRVTTKVDVYAFGVVLMELITGRKTLENSMPDDMSHLVTWFRRVLVNKDDIPKAVDKMLSVEEATMESICKVAELAGHCTANEAHQRPDMSHAVNVLAPLVEQWTPSCRDDDDDADAAWGVDMHMTLPQALQRWQANEGDSFSQTQSSIISKPPGLPDSFDSLDAR